MKRGRTETTAHPEQTQLISDQDNPLLIDVVVDHLFKLIPFNCEEFRNFRLVSKLFWKSSLPTWRRNTWISVNGRIYRSNNSCPYIECYLDMLGAAGDPYQLLGKFGFKKYKLEDWEFKFSAGGRINRKKLEFWSKVGDKMTHFKCSNSVFHTREDFQRVIFEFMPNLQFLSLERNVHKCGQPSLPAKPVLYNESAIWEEDLMLSPQEIRGNVSHVEISLGFNSNCKLEYQEDFPVWWSHFFARFPNIKVLKLHNLKPSYLRLGLLELLRLFDCVRMLRAKCGPHILAQLEDLDILSAWLPAYRNFPNRLITQLRNFAFPLKSLSLDVGYNDPMRDDGFRMILEAHCNTLQKLTVYRAPHENASPIHFPAGIHLPHLTELRLIGNVLDSHMFLQQTPNLKTLVVMDGNQPCDVTMGILKDSEDFSLKYLRQKQLPQLHPVRQSVPLEDIDDPELEQEGVVCPKLEVFILTPQFLLDSDKVEAMAKVMPNLKKLQVGLSKEGFQAVCKVWRNLEALHLEYLDYVNDKDIVLGIENGVKYRLPNITDLTRLKYFGTGLDCDNEALSNDSILHGLLALPNLEDVAIKLAPEVTEDVRLMLTSKFPQMKSRLCCSEENSPTSSSECDGDTD